MILASNILHPKVGVTNYSQSLVDTLPPEEIFEILLADVAPILTPEEKATDEQKLLTSFMAEPGASNLLSRLKLPSGRSFQEAHVRICGVIFATPTTGASITVHIPNNEEQTPPQ